MSIDPVPVIRSFEVATILAGGRGGGVPRQAPTIKGCGGSDAITVSLDGGGSSLSMSIIGRITTAVGERHGGSGGGLTTRGGDGNGSIPRNGSGRTTGTYTEDGETTLIGTSSGIVSLGMPPTMVGVRSDG